MLVFSLFFIPQFNIQTIYNRDIKGHFKINICIKFFAAALIVPLH